MAELVTFDGPNKLIIVAPGVTTLNVAADIYSAWVRWLRADTANAKYLMPFRTVGGDDLGGGRFAGLIVLIQNGWKIRPSEADHTLVLDGTLVAQAGAVYIEPTLGAFTVNVQVIWSSIVQGIATGAVTPTEIREAVWSASDSGWAAGTMGAWVRTRLLTVARFLGLS